ncbi:MAG: rhodanese-like domain-containing protein [Planctomycetota bacterium]
MSVSTITPAKLHELSKKEPNLALIDVRTPVEFREVHATLARNVPLETLDPRRYVEGMQGSAQIVYVICRSGSRGKQACEKLQAAGVANVVNVEGGTVAWEQAGLPVVRGKKTISLERQVRIAAGSLVLVGSLIGVFVTPYGIGLAAFVGAGLVFAGITDTCGMALLLARMPWNQIKEGSNSEGNSAVCSMHDPHPSMGK